MKKIYYLSLSFIAIILSSIDLTLNGFTKEPIIVIGSVIFLNLIELRNESVQWVVTCGYIFFAIVSLLHSNLVMPSVTIGSEELFISTTLFAGCLSITSSYREVFE